MALTNTPLPFGLRDVKIRPLAGDGTPGVGVDLPNAQTFSFSESEDFEELRGDDGLVAVHGLGPAVDWELENGGLPLEALVIMYGGTITESGTTPNQVKTYDKGGYDQRPYFYVEGQAISDSGGDLHAILYRCRATGELSGEFSDGSFFITGSSGQALPRESDDKLYSFVQNETAVAVVDGS